MAPKKRTRCIGHDGRGNPVFADPGLCSRCNPDHYPDCVCTCEPEVETLRRVVREQAAAMQRLVDTMHEADTVQETAKNVLFEGMEQTNAAMADPARDSRALREAHNVMAEAWDILRQED